MSEEEEQTYFDIYGEPLPQELPPKTITFIINPTLNDIWTRLGLRDPDIEIEKNKLDIALTKTYLEFMADAVGKFDETIHKIHDHKKEFQKVKRLYGDKTSKLEANDHLTLIEQERATNNEIEKLHKKYAPRLETLSKLCSKCRKHFDKLGIDDDARGDYNELGNTDYSQERVEGFKNMLASLKREESNRNNIFRSCEKSIRAISEEIDEPLSDQVAFVLEQQLVDNDSIKLLTQVSEDLMALKIQRYNEYDNLVEKVQHLYKVLQVQPENQVKIFNRPTPDAIELLRSELYRLQAYEDENREMLIDNLQDEIDQICDDMRVPEKLRPRFIGNSLDKKLDFLEDTVVSLRERKIKTIPIIKLLGQIEEIKDTIIPKSTDQQNPNISQQLIDKQIQNRIDTEIRPLERQLLELLIEFRKDNGFDFQFEGVTYIDTLSQTYLADDSEKFGTTVLDHKTPTTKSVKIPYTSLRATSYLATKSPKKYVSKRTPYTPKRTRKPLFED